MKETDWLAERNAQELLRQFVGRLSRRKLRLFAVQCCRAVESYLIDARSRNALAVAERFADGLATRHELRAALSDANDVWNTIHWGDDGSDDDVDAADVACQCVDRNAEVAAYGSADRAGEFIERRTGHRWYRLTQSAWLRDIFGNPFRPVPFAPAWRTPTAVALGLARTMYESRDFAALPILADALEEAGCDQPDVLTHCRDADLTHVRGCWVVDLVLGKS